MRSAVKLITVFRSEYVSQAINVIDIAYNPIDKFEKRDEESTEIKIKMPGATHFTSIETDGRSSCRIMFLRRFDERGFVFFTNHDGIKRNELNSNNYALMTFFRSGLFCREKIHSLHGPVQYKLDGKNHWNIQRLCL